MPEPATHHRPAGNKPHTKTLGFRFVLDMLDPRQRCAPVHIAEQKRHTMPDLSVPDA